MNTQGQAAEQLAADYLQRQGLRLLSRNFSCRFGEIDLIMQDATTLVFIEVRQRKSRAFGGAGASITAAKRQKLMLAAQTYLQQHGDAACRFDAILIEGALQENSIEWLRNVFDA